MTKKKTKKLACRESTCKTVKQLKKFIEKNKKEIFRVIIFGLFFTGFIILSFDYSRNGNTVGEIVDDIDFSEKKEVTLLEWRTKGVDFECEIYESGRKVIMRSKGENTRLEGADYGIELDVPAGSRAYTLYKGNWFYHWQEKLGVKYDFSKDKEAAEKYSLSERINGYVERGLKIDCKETEVNSVFAIPSLRAKYEDKTKELDNN